MRMLTILADLKRENIISESDYQFAKMIDRKQQPYGYTREQQNLAVLLAALVSFQVMQGHTALHLNSTAAKLPFGLGNSPDERDFSADILQKIGRIEPLAWQEALRGHIAFSDSPEKVSPLLFQHHLLYFYRYWQAERNIAVYLRQAVEFSENFATVETDKEILERLFPTQSEEPDWQKIAVATALRKRFCVISGGPGTGKTTTVARLLLALQEKQMRAGAKPLKVALAAPTGKAAARLKESIADSMTKLQPTFEVPSAASTIHRLLGIRTQSDKPMFHAKNPLHLDLLVVDEASMVDLFVMEKLLAALKPTTRLVMLGDKDQLTSVEAGGIMGELGRFITQGYSQTHSNYLYQVTGYRPVSQTEVPQICDSLCHLRKSYRFDENSGIGRVAAEVNAQQAGKSWQSFANPQFNDLVRIEYSNAKQFSEKQRRIRHCVHLVEVKAVELYRDYLELVNRRRKNPTSVSVDEIFNAFQKVRFLSALRVSELGAERLNQTIAEALRSAKLVKFNHSRDRYVGKPIIITQNSPQNHLSGGDIGIVLPDENGGLRVYFDTKTDGKHRSLAISRIPESEPAYVMTVHKSQGSEFEHALLVMPLNIAPVVSRELIYTAITRAKSKFTLFSDEKVWKQGIKTNIQRQSGLREQLSELF